MAARYTQEIAEEVVEQLKNVKVDGWAIFDDVVLDGSESYWNIFVRVGLERSTISLRREEETEEEEDLFRDPMTGVMDYETATCASREAAELANWEEHQRISNE